MHTTNLNITLNEDSLLKDSRDLVGVQSKPHLNQRNAHNARLSPFREDMMVTENVHTPAAGDIPDAYHHQQQCMIGFMKQFET